MSEQVGSDKQPLHFLPAEYDRKFFASLDGGQFDPFVLEAFDLVGEPEGIDGEFEIGIGGCVVPLLDQKEVVVDLVGIYFGGNLVEVDCQLGKVARVVGQRAGAFTGDS